MSDTNRGKVAFVAESSYGVQKTGSPLQLLRVTSDTLAQTANPIRSAEIRANRRLANVRTVGKQVSGALGFELSYGTLDTLLQAALLSATWTEVVTVTGTTFAAVASDNKITDSGNGLNVFTANQWVYVSGFTTAANNGFAKIVSQAAGELVLSGGTLVDEVAGDAVTITQGGRIVDGTTLTTFNFERIYDDLAQEIVLFTGMGVEGLSLAVPAEGMVTGSLDLIGKAEDSITASGGAGYTAITTTDPLQAAEVVGFLENQTALSFLNFTLALKNNLRVQRQCPTGISGLGTGQSDLSGTLQCYFTSKTLYDKWLDETASSLALSLRDAAGNGYVLDLPAVKFTAGKRDLTGPNGDVIADLGWTAYEDSGASCQMTITRFAA